MIEPLENRRLLSTYSSVIFLGNDPPPVIPQELPTLETPFSPGTGGAELRGEGTERRLVVTGTDADDEIWLAVEGNLVKRDRFLRVDINGETRFRWRIDSTEQPALARIEVNSGFGDDLVVMRDSSYHVFGPGGTDPLGANLVTSLALPADGAADATARAVPVVFEGAAGDDTLYGGSGNDTLLGGRGHDHLYGGMGDDLLAGGVGNDKLHGEFGSDVLWGGTGHDGLRGGETFYADHPDADRISGGAGNDTLDVVVREVVLNQPLGRAYADRITRDDSVADDVESVYGDDDGMNDVTQRVARHFGFAQAVARTPRTFDAFRRDGLDLDELEG